MSVLSRKKNIQVYVPATHLINLSLPRVGDKFGGHDDAIRRSLELSGRAAAIPIIAYYTKPIVSSPRTKGPGG
jgi:hypothetical protein